MRSKKHRSETRKDPSDPPSPPVAPGHEEIARRAYEVYLARGAGEAQALDDWLQAERELRTQAERSGMVTDPVCGMQLEAAKAAGKIEHAGRTFYFCSETCQKAFEKTPKRYVAG